jgi:ethanolamine utilization cobalamin adenosyltransferase
MDMEIRSYLHYTYRIYRQEKRMKRKPEHLTSLRGKRMVPKSCGRIAFRGKVDSLEAEVIEAQVLALELGDGPCVEYLGEILGLLRSIMAAEVKETPLSPPVLFGLDAEEIHRQSHDSGGKLSLPDYTQGPLAARLNSLRAKTREAEVLAVQVFAPLLGPRRKDLILALNRLSSALWWLFRRHTGPGES